MTLERVELPALPASFTGQVFEEPQLVFTRGAHHIDPRTGLELFGPYTLGPRHDPLISQITLGLVSARAVVPDARAWLARLRHPIANDGADPFTRPPFPGLAEGSSLRCPLVEGEALTRVISDTDLMKALAAKPLEARVREVTALYADALSRLARSEPRPNVVLLPISESTWDACIEDAGPRIDGRRLTSAQVAHRARGQMFLGLFGSEEEEQPVIHDLRSALKREAMRLGLPVQLIRESTLSPGRFRKRHLQDPATAAWNMATGLYYKAGGHPWRMASTASGTCYAGISFFLDRAAGTGMRASVAQIFSEQGEGLVMRGEPYEISPGDRSPHLTEAASERTMRGLLELYQAQMHDRPRRVVVHKTSRFSAHEENGIRAALDGIGQLDLVAIAPPEMGTLRLLRSGEYPTLRGTALRLEPEHWLLYTNGYVPYLRTYNGPHVPLPLEIQEMRGDTPEDDLLREILALSKMNWNSSAFSSALPITLLYAKRVGTILGELPSDETPRPEYRYYM